MSEVPSYVIPSYIIKVPKNKYYKHQFSLDNIALQSGIVFIDFESDYKYMYRRLREPTTFPSTPRPLPEELID